MDWTQVGPVVLVLIGWLVFVFCGRQRDHG